MSFGRRITNSSTATKLIASFAIIVVVLLGGNGFIYNQVAGIETRTQWSEHTYRVLAALEQIVFGVSQQQVGVRGYLITGDASGLETMRAAREQGRSALAEAKHLTADNAVQQERLATIEQDLTTWQTDFADKEVALMASAETQAQARNLVTAGGANPLTARIRKTVADASAMEQLLLEKRQAAQAAAFSLSYAAVFGSGALGVLLACLLSWVLSGLIARPLRDMTDTMRRLAARDMGVAIPARGREDEIGRMADAVEVFRDGLVTADRLGAEQAAQQAAREQRAVRLDGLVRGFELKIGSTVGSLASGSSELKATALSMTQTAGQTNQQASAVAAAADEAGVSVQAVASAAEELSASINDISRQVAQSAKMTDMAVTDARRTDTIVRALSEGADKIGNVVGLITTIAGQTNLLALNATIEAARAGDAGKGFAVVASEVKNLANQTAKATEEIGAQISQIKSVTKEAVEAIRRITGTIGDMSANVTAIAASVEQQGAATAEIARNVHQTAQAAQGVTATIGGVSQAANDTGAAANHVLGAAGNLATQAERLSEEVKGFVADVRAA